MPPLPPPLPPPPPPQWPQQQQRGTGMLSLAKDRSQHQRHRMSFDLDNRRKATRGGYQSCIGVQLLLAKLELRESDKKVPVPPNLFLPKRGCNLLSKCHHIHALQAVPQRHPTRGRHPPPPCLPLALKPQLTNHKLVLMTFRETRIECETLSRTRRGAAWRPTARLRRHGESLRVKK
jgi:hypothetical protein